MTCYYQGKKPLLTWIEMSLGYNYIWGGSARGWIKVDKYGGPINKLKFT